jgi:HEAT repeat protein
MHVGYAEWHDGIGYDLDALAALGPDEREKVEELLLARRARDWRDIEALDRLGSERALAALERALEDKSVDVRIEVAQRLAARKRLSETQIDDIIVLALRVTTLLDGMVKTLNFAAAHATPAVRQQLLACTLDGHRDVRVHAAALLHFLGGRSDSHFDWKHRPFYLRFGAKNRDERLAAHAELCREIGVDPATGSASPRD